MRAATFATVLPYGFSGGPVVAEAMLPLYAQFGNPEGYTMSLLAATFGMLAGVVVGAMLANLAPLAAQQSSHLPPPASHRAASDAVGRSERRRLLRVRAALKELQVECHERHTGGA